MKFDSEWFGSCRRSSAQVQGSIADGKLVAFNSSPVGRSRYRVRVLLRPCVVITMVIVRFMRNHVLECCSVFWTPLSNTLTS